MGTLYFDTGGNAANSGSTDDNSPTHSGAAATVSGSDVTIDTADDISAIPTSGATQGTILISDATNSNQKIFWITAVNNTTKVVTVSVAPTGVVASAWRIGGRHVMTAASWEAAVRPADIVIVNNSPASSTADVVTKRVAGTAAGGRITFMGKVGTRPVLLNTSTTQCIDGAVSFWYFANLELDQDGASGDAAVLRGDTYYNVKASDAGGGAFNVASSLALIVACEATGVGGDCVAGGDSCAVMGSNLHDNTGDGFETTNNNARGTASLIRNIIDSCGGRGVLTGAITNNIVLLLDGNTIYGCGNSGLEVVDTDFVVYLTNNIFSENGNAAGEFNVEWTTGSAELLGFHAWNVFFHSGGGGGDNVSGLTVNAHVASSEFTTDPQFTNAAGADFSIATGSPAKAVGGPTTFLGGNANFLDIGAVQRQEAGSSGGGQRVIGG